MARMKAKKWRRQQAETVLLRLDSEYEQKRTALDYRSDWELLVAVILSAQATDKKVNEVTRALFEKYRSLEDYAAADPAEFEQDIHQTGFFRNKTKSVLGAAQKLLSEYDGRVPHNMKDLLTLPGVARKTANVVLQNIDPEAFAKDPDSGIAVDTHVHRLAERLGLGSGKNPQTTEQELLEVVPRDKRRDITYLLIDHGRAICSARRPNCTDCVLNDICPSAFSL